MREKSGSPLWGISSRQWEAGHVCRKKTMQTTPGRPETPLVSEWLEITQTRPTVSPPEMWPPLPPIKCWGVSNSPIDALIQTFHNSFPGSSSPTSPKNYEHLPGLMPGPLFSLLTHTRDLTLFLQSQLSCFSNSHLHPKFPAYPHLDVTDALNSRSSKPVPPLLYFVSVNHDPLSHPS